CGCATFKHSKFSRMRLTGLEDLRLIVEDSYIGDVDASGLMEGYDSDKDVILEFRRCRLHKLSLKSMKRLRVSLHGCMVEQLIIESSCYIDIQECVDFSMNRIETAGDVIRIVGNYEIRVPPSSGPPPKAGYYHIGKKGT